MTVSVLFELINKQLPFDKVYFKVPVKMPTVEIENNTILAVVIRVSVIVTWPVIKVACPIKVSVTGISVGVSLISPINSFYGMGNLQ